MAATYYELLGVPSTATPDEIRSAFRREIARYHPDKVQHLGDEFQNIAAIRSAELTQAYKTLTDGTLRADYDARVRTAFGQPRTSSPVSFHKSPESFPLAPQAPMWSPPPVPDSSSSPEVESATSAVRSGVSNFVRKAAVVRFRRALQAEFGFCEEESVHGFEVVCAPPRTRFWSKLPPRIYAKFVQYVDGAAVAETGKTVCRAAKNDEREVCVFLMAPYVMPAAELDMAITRERRKSRSGGVKLTIVPVNTRSWAAYVPSDAPPAVRSLMAHLRRS